MVFKLRVIVLLPTVPDAEMKPSRLNCPLPPPPEPILPLPPDVVLNVLPLAVTSQLVQLAASVLFTPFILIVPVIV